MAPRTKKEPEIHIGDLHLIDDGFLHSYKASWKEGGVMATLILDIVEREHWRHGKYRKHAYELVGSINTVSGRPLGSIQEENALMLLRELRTQMLAAMIDAGWQEVDTTREGRPIYQYRPGPRLAVAAPVIPVEIVPLGVSGQGEMDASSSESDQVEQRAQQKTVVRSTRPVTFTCQWCCQQVTEQRYPSHVPLYCHRPACKKEATREKTRERVANWRKLHPDARRKEKDVTIS